MSKRLVLNRKGVKEMLNSDEIREVLQGYAESTQSNAEAMSGEAYALKQTKTDRIGFSVFPETKAAAKDNSDNKTLMKSVGGK